MRSARSRTWLTDSSPLITSAVLPLPDRPLLRHVEQQGGLADARLAGEQHHAAGHEAAAEHPVELADAGGDRAGGLGADRGDRPGGLAGCAGRHMAHRAQGRAGRGLHDRAPLAALRAAADPLGRLDARTRHKGRRARGFALVEAEAFTHRQTTGAPTTSCWRSSAGLRRPARRAACDRDSRRQPDGRRGAATGSIARVDHVLVRRRPHSDQFTGPSSSPRLDVSGAAAVSDLHLAGFDR